MSENSVTPIDGVNTGKDRIVRSSPFRHATFLSVLSITLIAACQTVPDYGAFESQLAAAGFVMKPANTPERQAMLGRLPAHQFLLRQNGSTTHYVYADPLVCDCLYVGTQAAFDQYRANQAAQAFVDAQQLAALTFSDPAWSWAAWGPWAPDDASFGFVYGPIGW